MAIMCFSFAYYRCTRPIYFQSIYLLPIPPISNLRRRGNTHELVMEFSKDVLLVFYRSTLFCNRHFY